MSKYRFVLLDADNTLLDFDRAEEIALQTAFARWEVPLTEAVRARYQVINSRLWEQFERGEVSKEKLQSQRFDELFAELGLPHSGADFNRTYMDALGEQGCSIPGAADVCRRLAQLCPLYLVTNGVSRTQHRRLQGSDITPYIADVFVSEDTGYQKPQKEYFDYVAAHIPGFDRAAALLVGDSLTSDMMGGQNAGIDTCWYNPGGKPNALGVPITYEIARLEELPALVAGA
ncbi:MULTISPECIES: YjjG family noncanonical pyrimidine nucleotidase [Eubacteriales]|uniref:2-haloacid dehalogenase n=1 Tax=Bittarella massiliensis (ex Durand et al. 2017) TaxID=1720313 RepID=A0AAQ1RW26_9FIRM|nr:MULTISPECIES: YjjG family noncanonical pyrimidine nucleotidase [Eubacteriales]MZL69053.1 noncanonical pyrimidine nucleotidase, YjjG family [Bittarella massiliensis (ex Durand et al. 2017)]MZL79927.1 noncanonical pyrimidine nucleotidase, YjjG family [Bittarella massiliensis (ex Durand et al. 2017)]SHG10680.1 2-haloacid dehalogenase [Bittarella massiliensis (ex Durand et al. 2017)]